MSNASVTFSFDCEGKWGMADHPRKWDSKLTQKELLKAYDFILATLHANNLSATFAFVAAFTETREEFIEESLPNLSSKNLLSWLGKSKSRIIDKAEEGWFMPELLEMVRQYDIHEIASHGYTHVPFNILDVDEARSELCLVRSWADKKNIDCKTMVYPRNIIKHESLLEDFGIFAYRDIPQSLVPAGFPKIVKALLEEICIFKKAQQIEKSHPLKIPGGTFINWRYGSRKLIPPSVSLLKYKNMINDSKRRNRVAHFWTHPHNFITSPSTKCLFRRLCEEVSMERNKSTLVVKNQNAYLG